MRHVPPLLASLLLAAVPALAQQAAPPPSITISGHGDATLVPDTAEITLGVVTDRPRAVDAAAENARATAAVIEAVKAEGVEPRDIATMAVELSPLTDQPAHGTPKTTGFHALNTLLIKVKPIDKAAAVLGKLVDKGANSIEGIRFAGPDDAGLRDRLRADAVRDAKRQAEIYVGALGLKLGSVLGIVPGGADEPRPPRYGMLAARAAAMPAVPLEAGSERIEETVSVTWALAPGAQP